MAQPQIKGALESADFTVRATPEVRAKLDACLRADHAHIMPKARGGKDGAHVTAIQNALMKIRGSLPSLGIPAITDPSGTYGLTTAAAVLKYKDRRGIRRSGQPLDNIVGRMTITQLDDDLRVGHQVDPLPGPLPGPGPGPGPSVTTAAVCTQNSNITLDGTTAPQAAGTTRNSGEKRPSKSATDWIKETQATFDLICSNPLGQRIVAAVQKPLLIIPWPEANLNATTTILNGKWTIRFTASDWDEVGHLPQLRHDETLVHEMIHFLDQLCNQYTDPADQSMQWENKDFFTVNGTNIYSLTVSRGIRKDHPPGGGIGGIRFMPPRYASDPLEHMIIFMENYQLAFRKSNELFNILKSQQISWNPFRTFTPNVTARKVFIETEQSPKNWKWLYELFSDSNARWSDTNNVAEYGIGKWRKEGTDLVIDWKNGASDKFSDITPSNGRTKMASGAEYSTHVTNA